MNCSSIKILGIGMVEIKDGIKRLEIIIE